MCHSDADSRSSLSVDKSGDFIALALHARSGMVQSAIYGTLFDMRRVLPIPDIDLTAGKSSVPAQPQPVSMGPASFLGSWFTISKSLSGSQIDELCAYPKLSSCRY